MTIYEILAEYKTNASSKRDQGFGFEKLFRIFLKKDPTYANLFDEVWLWKDFLPGKSMADCGIDLVARERLSGKYCAIQCKWYGADTPVSQKDVSQFLNASGMCFYDTDGTKITFSSRYFVATTENWGINARKLLEYQNIPVQIIGLSVLANSPIDWSFFSFEHMEEIKLLKRKEIRPHQSAALVDVMKGFDSGDRGKLIMACGTGKTFTSLKIAEAVTKNDGTVLFLVPSIALLSQSLREWNEQSAFRLKAFAVDSVTNFL